MVALETVQNEKEPIVADKRVLKTLTRNIFSAAD